MDASTGAYQGVQVNESGLSVMEEEYQQENVFMLFEELEAQEDDSESGEEEEEEEEEGRHENVDGMYLSKEERDWALEIKATVEDPFSVLNEDYQVKPVSDFEYVHFGLVSNGNLEEALMRMSVTQSFQREYQVDDTLEQSAAFIEQFMNLQPGFLLQLDLCPETKGGLVAVDLAKKDPRLLKAAMKVDRTWRDVSLFWYYVLRTTQPNFEAIRQGTVWLFEGSNFDWFHMDIDHERRLHDELWAYYPWIPRATRVYNTSTVATMFWSLLKGFASDRMSRTIQMGCQLDPYDEASFGSPGPKLTLSDLYLQPNPEQAQNFVIQRSREILAMRSQNERSFRL